MKPGNALLRPGNVVFIFLIIFFLVVSVSFQRKSIQEQQQAIYKPLLDSTPVMKILNDFNCFLNNTINEEGMVGAAYTITENGRIVHTGTYGVKKWGTYDSVDNHTVFRLASVSKGFAGVLAAILENRNVLNLNDPIIQYLPDFKLGNEQNTQLLTIQNILSHTSGLVPYTFDNLIEAGVPLNQIIDRLNEVEISGAPGTVYGYQNVVFSIFDTIMQVKTHHNYEYLIRSQIFKPLHMNQASIGGEVFRNTENNVALPHSGMKGNFCTCMTSECYYSLLPAAGINASIEDMGKWLLALLGNSPETIDSTVMNKIGTPVVETPLRYGYYKYWSEKPEKYYSLGWRIYMYKGRKIIHHGGYVKGYRAEIAFCPEENTGIAYLQNCESKVASQVLPTYFDFLFHEIDVEKPMLAEK